MTGRQRDLRRRPAEAALPMLPRLIADLLGPGTRRLLTWLLLPIALAATVAACGGSDDDAGAVAATTTPTATQAPSTTTAPSDQEWQRVVPGGDCRCSDGSEFSFWLRKANPRKVVFYLQDGGACFSAKTCAPERDLYQINGRRAHRQHHHRVRARPHRAP